MSSSSSTNSWLRSSLWHGSATLSAPSRRTHTPSSSRPRARPRLRHGLCAPDVSSVRIVRPSLSTRTSLRESGAVSAAGNVEHVRVERHRARTTQRSEHAVDGRPSSRLPGDARCSRATVRPQGGPIPTPTAHDRPARRARTRPRPRQLEHPGFVHHLDGLDVFGKFVEPGNQAGDTGRDAVATRWVCPSRPQGWPTSH